MYKLKRLKPQKKLISLNLNMTGIGVKTLIVPNEEYHIYIIAYQAGLRIISPVDLSVNESITFINTFSDLDLSPLGINSNMLIDAGASENITSSFYLTNDEPNQYVQDVELYLDGTPEGLPDCFLSILVVPKNFNYAYELQGQNVIIGEMDTNLEQRDFFENLYPNNYSYYHAAVLAGNIDLTDFETNLTSLPAADPSLDLITLQRI